MNDLFENGLLCHERIYDTNSQVLDRMQQGFSFLTTWLDSLLKEGETTDKDCIFKVQLFCSLY